MWDSCGWVHFSLQFGMRLSYLASSHTFLFSFGHFGPWSMVCFVMYPLCLQLFKRDSGLLEKQLNFNDSLFLCFGRVMLILFLRRTRRLLYVFATFEVGSTSLYRVMDASPTPSSTAQETPTPPSAYT